MMIDDKGIYRLGGANMTSQIITDNSQVVINQAKQIEELEQQLAESVAYGESLNGQGLKCCPFCGTNDDLHITEYAGVSCANCGANAGSLGKPFGGQVAIWNERVHPSPLVNKMKAEAVREYGEHLSHAEDRLTPEDYAKQLEQTKA